MILFLGRWLEMLERKNTYIFGSVILLLAITFTSLNHVQFETPPTVIEKNISSILAINAGGGPKETDNFLPRPPLVPPSNPDNPGNIGSSNSGSSSSQNYDPKPKYPWGIDPSYNPGGGSGGGSALPANKIPDNDEWIDDPHVWDKIQDKDSTTSEEEENIKKDAKWEDNIDFSYESDSNGNPTLLVPNAAKARTKRDYNRVYFDQSASHMHHSPDFDISLPADFDMNKYKSLDRAGRIAYAKEKLPRETIINYQNEIAKSMSPLFGTKKTLSVPGFAGKDKRNTELTIQQKDIPDKNIISIIREDGTHISSFSLNEKGIRKLAADDFWVLKKRNS